MSDIVRYSTMEANTVVANTILADTYQDLHTGYTFNARDLRDMATQVRGAVVSTDELNYSIEALWAEIEALRDKLQDIISNPERKYIEVDGKHLFWLLEGGDN